MTPVRLELAAHRSRVKHSTTEPLRSLGVKFVSREYIFLPQIFRSLKLSVLFCETSANSADPDQTPQNATSDQGLHCLLTEYSIRI